MYFSFSFLDQCDTIQRNNWFTMFSSVRYILADLDLRPNATSRHAIWLVCYSRCYVCMGLKYQLHDFVVWILMFRKFVRFTYCIANRIVIHFASFELHSQAYIYTIETYLSFLPTTFMYYSRSDRNLCRLHQHHKELLSFFLAVFTLSALIFYQISRNNFI